MKNVFLLSCFFLTGLVLSSWTDSTSGAEPAWDTDYELYVGVPGWDYQLWIKPEGGWWYLEGTFDSAAEANNWLFFLVEHNVVSSSASTTIQPVATVDWHYWLTFETYTQAADAADDWQALGFQTDIRSIFGGYLFWQPQKSGLFYR